MTINHFLHFAPCRSRQFQPESTSYQIDMPHRLSGNGGLLLSFCARPEFLSENLDLGQIFKPAICKLEITVSGTTLAGSEWGYACRLCVSNTDNSQADEEPDGSFYARLITQKAAVLGWTLCAAQGYTTIIRQDRADWMNGYSYRAVDARGEVIRDLDLFTIGEEEEIRLWPVYDTLDPLGQWAFFALELAPPESGMSVSINRKSATYGYHALDSRSPVRSMEPVIGSKNIEVTLRFSIRDADLSPWAASHAIALKVANLYVGATELYAERREVIEEALYDAANGVPRNVGNGNILAPNGSLIRPILYTQNGASNVVDGRSAVYRTAGVTLDMVEAPIRTFDELPPSTTVESTAAEAPQEEKKKKRSRTRKRSIN